jgi:hypothetical protein
MVNLFSVFSHRPSQPKKRTEFFFNKSRNRPIAILLPAQECFELVGDDLI